MAFTICSGVAVTETCPGGRPGRSPSTLTLPLGNLAVSTAIYDLPGLNTAGPVIGLVKLSRNETALSPGLRATSFAAEAFVLPPLYIVSGIFGTASSTLLTVLLTTPVVPAPASVSLVASMFC